MSNLSPIKKRILQYLDKKNISKYKFYQITGISNGVLDKPTGLTEDNILKFITHFRDINLIWLLIGEGDIIRHYKSESKNNVLNESESDYSIKKHINDLEKTIEILHEQLNDAIKDKDIYRDLLKNQIELKKQAE